MLDQHGVEYRYREYTDEPLSIEEIRTVVKRLGLPVRDLLRTRDRAMKDAGLVGDEDDAVLIAAMSEHPTLLQRPIAIKGDVAVVGRPPENLLALVRS